MWRVELYKRRLLKQIAFNSMDLEESQSQISTIDSTDNELELELELMTMTKRQVFSANQLKTHLMPTLEKLTRQEPESFPFRLPVDPICWVFSEILLVEKMQITGLNKNNSSKNMTARDFRPSSPSVTLIVPPGPSEREPIKLRLELEPGQNSSTQNIMTQTPGPSRLLSAAGPNAGSESKISFSFGQTAHGQESKSQNQVPNFGFALASGKNVIVSGDAVRKAREVFSGDEDINLPAEFYEPSVIDINLEREIYESTMAFLADDEEEEDIVSEGISDGDPDSTTP